ncbi:hypothetical protein EFN79_07100 [Propionibacterium freudenreichii]|uniref:hypothetical protein n=1 Tax=Propionibacterium freudenreichii TaxID=1744 RepID=UPI0021A75833|nr:hypothetical protein [Propionibacterium freudenreichii]MCT2978520.1 hypothetical protein [Propionibacterium freudenreichii]MCT2987502.1 hypothetical protein [Propionibacterium freudenreichii]
MLARPQHRIVDDQQRATDKHEQLTGLKGKRCEHEEGTHGEGSRSAVGPQATQGHRALQADESFQEADGHDDAVGRREPLTTQRGRRAEQHQGGVQTHHHGHSARHEQHDHASGLAGGFERRVGAALFRDGNGL